MSDTTLVFHAQLKLLREAFAKELPDRLANLEAGWKALQEGGWEVEAMLTFHRQVHSLTGSGGTFGFPQVSEKARGLEVQLKTILSTGSPPSPEEVARLQTSLNALLQVARGALAAEAVGLTE